MSSDTTAAIAAATPPSGAGAPIRDILLVGGIISAATIAVLAVVVAYRRGGAKPLRAAEGVAERLLGVPGWAAIPGVAAVASAVVTFMGAIWDISIHVDKGRDNGPFGTIAHYPLLIGLVLLYLCGILAVGMAPRSRAAASRAAIRLPELGPVPVGALLILAGGGYAMIGFPLDDMWHRVFGQDVTLWGPTHTMFFGGIITAAVGAAILLAEGVRSAGREPFGGWKPWHRPLPGLLGGVFLFVATHATDEFNWAVPQYRQVWQPLLLMFFAALALVLARALGGRGATIGALMTYLPLQIAEVVMIGAFHQIRPASVLFVVEALVVELLWARAASRGRVLRGGVVAGLGVGTLGFAGEYAWSQVGFPLPWHSGLLAEAIPSAALAGLAGGTLGALMALALQGRLPSVRRPLPVALGAAALALALCVNAGISTAPKGSARLVLLNVRTAVPSGGLGHRTQVADLRVRLSRPGLAKNANWAYVLAWQGKGRFSSRLVPDGDGWLRTTKPVPIGGTWKSFARFQNGRTLESAAVRMPRDTAVDFAGFPARTDVVRPLVRDTKLLQIERKKDGPLWAWTPALAFVMFLNLALMALVAAGCVRMGRLTTGGDDDTPEARPVTRQAPRVQRKLVGA